MMITRFIKTYKMSKLSSEERFKEIDLIQSCIERMARNSFYVKGWALTIFTGSTIFLKGENLTSSPLMLLATIIPFVSFWLLDSFYLYTERQYRKLYDKVITERQNGNMLNLFSLNIGQFEFSNWIKTVFSITLICFYMIPLLATICIIIYNIFL